MNYRFMRGIEQQFLALQKGLLELVPAQLLRPFDERELELVICGLGTIDINDWKINTRLKVIQVFHLLPSCLFLILHLCIIITNVIGTFLALYTRHTSREMVLANCRVLQ